MFIDSLNEQARRINQADIGAIERSFGATTAPKLPLEGSGRETQRRLITATAVVSSMGWPRAFKDARAFAAWMGLVRVGAALARTCSSWASASAVTRTSALLLMNGARPIVRQG